MNKINKSNKMNKVIGEHVVILKSTNRATPGDHGIITMTKSNGWLKIVLYNHRTISVRNGPDRVRVLESYHEKVQPIFTTPESDMNSPQVPLFSRWIDDGVWM